MRGCDLCGSTEGILTFIVSSADDESVVVVCDECRWESARVPALV